MYGYENLTDEDKLFRSDRGRLIDQWKRFYAVLMGFAITVLIGSAATNIKAGVNIEYLTIVILNFITVLSLVMLTFLAAERHLEEKYVVRFKERHTLRVLIFDLVAMFTLAPLLIIAGLTAAIDTGDYVEYPYFVISLMVFHLFDFVILLCGLMFNQWNDGDTEESIHCHRILVTNLLILSAVNSAAIGLAYWMASELYEFPVALPFLLAMIHTVRFYIDLSYNRNHYFLYYPWDKKIRPLPLVNAIVGRLS